MTRTRASLITLMFLTAIDSASAQFFPVVGVPVLVPNGVGFQYNGRRLSVNGFFGNGAYSPGVLPITPGGFPLMPGQPVYLYTPGYFPPMSPYGYPFGVQTSAVTLHIINPPGIAGGRAHPLEDFDINGIDLDVEPAARIWNRQAAAPKVKAAQRELEARKAEAAPVPPAAPERKVEAVVVNNVPPKPEVVPAWQRLIDLGTKAFRGGEYGVALSRFRQAGNDRAHGKFLEAHACIAVGKYHEAVELIHEGLQRDPAWPEGAFRPRAELYDNDGARWQQHLVRLQEAERKRPKHADYPFLLGYLAWFDGDRAGGVERMQQARALIDDPRWIDLFLKAGAKQ